MSSARQQSPVSSHARSRPLERRQLLLVRLLDTRPLCWKTLGGRRYSRQVEERRRLLLVRGLDPWPVCCSQGANQECAWRPGAPSVAEMCLRKNGYGHTTTTYHYYSILPLAIWLTFCVGLVSHTHLPIPAQQPQSQRGMAASRKERTVSRCSVDDWP